MASLLAEVRAERKDSLKGAGWHRPPDHLQARLRVVAQMIRHPRQAARGQNRFGDRTMAGIALQASDFRVFRFVHEVSCPRFLWTPYCPEKLEDDSVEGNGKTVIDAAVLVGSEGG